MFDKKRALICSIILYSIGTIALLTYLVGVVALDAFPYNYRFILPIWFIIFYGGALIMTVVFFRLKKKEAATQKSAKPKPEFTDEQFNGWLTKFEPFTKLGAQLTETKQHVFSKFGGLPLVPENFVWPTWKNHALPFLLQIDFSEINVGGKISGFPNSGLLYLFADSNEINAPNFERGEEEFAQDRTFKILFFDNTCELTTPTKPDTLEIVYKEFYVSSKISKTYPDMDDCEEAFEIYCNRPMGGMDDAYDMLQWQNTDSFMIGGWASYVQSGGYIQGLKENEKDEWTLLMQIGSVHDDDNFMWGDCGTLYFYIRVKDLKERNFNRVKMDMQCT